jgi:hypothetical protein
MKRLLNLTLHCGGNESTMEQVRSVQTPQATETWCPVGHHELIDSVIATLGGSGLRVTQEAHALWQDGNRYFGSFQLENGSQHDDYALVVGLRNSHDKSFPAGLACGSGVFVCDNLAFSGEVKLSRRHTARIREDLPRLISTAVGRLGTMKVNQEKRIEAYKAHPITDQQAHDLVIRAIDAKAVPLTRIPGVLHEWRHPSHDEFGPRNAWSLFNGFSEIYKLGNVTTTLARSMPLHGLFDQLVGLKIMDTETLQDATIEGGEAMLV